MSEPGHEQTHEVNARAVVPVVAANKEPANANIENPEVEPQHEHEHEHEHGGGMIEKHSVIGISLVTGFIFMLLVDQIGGNMHSHSVPSDAESAGHVQNRNKITATLGLVVHAAG